MTDEYFAQAAQNGTPGGTVTSALSAPSRNTPQIEPQGAEDDKKESPVFSEGCERLPAGAASSETSGQNDRCTRQDSNNSGFRGENERIFQSGAESGARSPDSAPVDPELQAVAEAWATLPQAVKAGIVAMVKAAKGPA